jgi:hypothetical protein
LGTLAENLAEDEMTEPVLYLQSQISRLYMQREKLTVQEFLALDKKYDLLGLLEAGYEPFHLMGEQGVLNEIHKNINDETTEPKR